MPICKWFPFSKETSSTLLSISFIWRILQQFLDYIVLPMLMLLMFMLCHFFLWDWDVHRTLVFMPKLLVPNQCCYDKRVWGKKSIHVISAHASLVFHSGILLGQYSGLGEERFITQLGQPHSQPNTWLPRGIYTEKKQKTPDMKLTHDSIEQTPLHHTKCPARVCYHVSQNLQPRINQELKSPQTVDIHPSNTGGDSSCWFH